MPRQAWLNYHDERNMNHKQTDGENNNVERLQEGTIRSVAARRKPLVHIEEHPSEINVKRSRGAKGSETDETSPTRRAECGKTARTVR